MFKNINNIYKKNPMFLWVDTGRFKSLGGAIDYSYTWWNINGRDKVFLGMKALKSTWHWHRNGYLILAKMFSHGTIRCYNILFIFIKKKNFLLKKIKLIGFQISYRKLLFLPNNMKKIHTIISLIIFNSNSIFFLFVFLFLVISWDLKESCMEKLRAKKN